MRRTLSTSRDISFHACTSEVSSRSCVSQRPQEFHCGECSLSLRPRGPALGFAHLILRVGKSEFAEITDGSAEGPDISTPPRKCTDDTSPSAARPRTYTTESIESGAIPLSGACERLNVALERMLRDAGDVVMTYDFQGVQRLPARMSRDLTKFTRSSGELALQVKSCALLIDGNIVASTMSGAVGRFVDACRPNCPFLICHCEAKASDFFRQSLGCPPDIDENLPVGFDSGVSASKASTASTAQSTGGRSRASTAQSTSSAPRASFVSVMHVLEASSTTPSSTGACLACLASMAPPARALIAPPEPGDNRRTPSGFLEDAASMHTLPNGDVRVIQSAPLLGAMVDIPALAVGTIRSLTSFGGSGGVEFPCGFTAMAALKFECRHERLQHLLGVHFHIAELAADAEQEPESPQQAGCFAAIRGSASGCWAAAALLFGECMPRAAADRAFEALAWHS